MRIPFAPGLSIDSGEISETFVRASGPGGQHVNTTSTAVELRFDAGLSPSLPEPLKERLRTLPGQRMTREGVVIITADTHRSQKRNRDEALERLIALLRAASIRPRIRRPTRPTLASKVRRLKAKQHRAGIKSGRRGSPDGSD